MNEGEIKKKKVDDIKTAKKLFSSHRGSYIIGQALYEAIKAMEARPERQQEPSNVSDMKFLMDNLFPMYAGIQRVDKIYKIALSKLKRIPEVQKREGAEE